MPDEIPWHKQFGAKDRWPTEEERIAQKYEEWCETFRSLVKRGKGSNTVFGSAYFSPNTKALDKFKRRKCECGETEFVEFAGNVFRVEVYGDEAEIHVSFRG